MSIDYKSSTDRNSPAAPGPANAPRTRGRQALSLVTDSPKAANVQRSPDPYNSSGSFDRTKNWARVGKR
jgi:hypothetical protein